MKLRERFLRWWRPAAYYETHPLTEEERQVLEEAVDRGAHTLGGPINAPFGRPSIPDDESPGH
jgi:hypothetical protein